MILVDENACSRIFFLPSVSKSTLLQMKTIHFLIFFPMKTGDEVGAELSKKHGNTLKSVAALRGAAQIIELAIETLKKELPPAPPSVKDLRRTESVAKQSVVSQGRLEGIKNRGKPKSEDDSTVGRM